MKNLNKKLCLYGRPWKEDFDEQYKECISVGAYDKIYLKKNPVVFDKTNLSAFKTRSKIAHSPPNSTENKKALKSSKEASGHEDQMENGKSNYNQESSVTEERVIDEDETEEEELFTCDMILGQQDNDKAVFDLLRPSIDCLQGSNNTSLFINVFKSLINMDSREVKESEPNFFNLVFKHLFNLSQSEKRQIFFSFYSLQANGRIEDMLVTEDKKPSKKKEKKSLIKKEIASIQTFFQTLNSVRTQLINKKQPLAYFFSFSLKSQQPQRKKSKLIIFDLLSLSEKGNLAVADVKNYNTVAKLISTVFALQKEETGSGLVDPLMRVLRKSLVDHVDKTIFICNFRNALPFYNQNQQLMHFMNPIFEKSNFFDCLFVSMSSEQHRKTRDSLGRKVDSELKKLQEQISKLQELDEQNRLKIVQLTQHLENKNKEITKLEEDSKMLKENNSELRQKIARMAKTNQSSEDLAFMFENSILSEPLSIRSAKSRSKLKETLPTIASTPSPKTEDFNEIRRESLGKGEEVKALQQKCVLLETDLFKQKQVVERYRKLIEDICQQMQMKVNSDSDAIKTLSEYVCKFLLITSTFETKEKDFQDKIQVLENDLSKEKQEKSRIMKLCSEKISNIKREYSEDMDKAKGIIDRYCALLTKLERNASGSDE